MTCIFVKNTVFSKNSMGWRKETQHGKCSFKPIHCGSARRQFCCYIIILFNVFGWGRPSFPWDCQELGCSRAVWLWWWLGWIGIRCLEGQMSGMSIARTFSRWLWEQRMTNDQIMSPEFLIQEALKMQHYSFGQWIKFSNLHWEKYSTNHSVKSPRIL